MLAILEGRRPELPKNAVDLGFTEPLWETVEKCWLEDWSARPDVEYILSRLSMSVDSRHTGGWVVVRGVGVVELASWMSLCVGRFNEGLPVSFLCIQTPCPVAERIRLTTGASSAVHFGTDPTLTS